jgi:hypothetical protein
MNVEYQLGTDDLIAYHVYHHFRSRTVRRLYFRSWFTPPLIGLILCTGLWYLAQKESHTPLRTFVALLPLFAFAPLYLIYFPWAYRRRFRKIVGGMVAEGKNRELFSPRRVTTSPEGISEISDLAQRSFSWPAVDRVVCNDDYVFVYTSALNAIIVPGRAFSTQSDFERFVAAFSTYQKGHQSLA